MIFDHDALARAAQAYLSAHQQLAAGDDSLDGREKRADAAASLQLLFLPNAGNTAEKSMPGDEARLFQWLAERAQVGWNLTYDHVEVRFPLETEFSCLADAVRKAQANDHATIG